MAAAIALSAAVGFLLGGLPPAYILSRLIGGIDIRSVGTRNAGARNVYHQVGPAAGAATAVFDLGKGIAALLVAERLFGVGGLWLFVPAWAPVLGHIFPPYLGFRGGRGMATAVGLYLFLCARAVAAGAFPWPSLAAVLGAALLVFLATRNGDTTALAAFLFLSVQTLLELGLSPPGLLMGSLALFCLALSVRNVLVHRVFVLEETIEMRWWRVIARPFALLFIPIDLLAGRTVLLFLLGALALVFSITDLVRILTRVELRRLFKSKESRRFSSMTSFLVAIFIMFLVFPDNVPYQGLAFITVGDMFSKLIGLRFGRLTLLRDRTLQGSLGFAAGSFMAGWVLRSLFPIPVYMTLAGPVFATNVELFSMDLDDNFTVGIISSGFLFALRYFL